MARLPEVWFIGPTNWCIASGGLVTSGNATTNEKYKTYNFVSGGIELSDPWVVTLRIIIRSASGGISLYGKESYNIYYTRQYSPPRNVHIIRQAKNYSSLERV